MIVVSDTSAISALMRTGRDGLLPALFEQVVVPVAVRDELLRWHSELPAFVSVRQTSRTDEVAALRAELDSGESEAIVLALEIAADLLLMDEKKGRHIAMQRGVKVVGLLGVLLLAKRRGLLTEIRTVLDDLENVAGFRISLQVRDEILRVAGED